MNDLVGEKGLPEGGAAPDDAPLRPQDLPGQDLTGRDLSKIEGLLPEHLAGTILTGATLPPEIAKFEAVAQVKAISSEARKIFIGLLAACVYSWVVIGSTQDVDLILNSLTSPLPLPLIDISVPIPIAGFYTIGAAVLAGLYCYFHLYLLWLWRAFARLPAIFPDGVTLDDKTDPWLLTNLVRGEFPHLRATAPPLARLENLLTILLAWWLVPLTLIALWARYLPAHNIGGLVLLAFLIAFTIFFGRHTFRLARATLGSKLRPDPTEPPGGQRLALVIGIARRLGRLCPGRAIVWFLLPLTIIIGLSLTALWQSPRNVRGQVVVFSFLEPWRSLEEVEPTLAQLLNFVGIRTYADLRKVEVERPEDWDGEDWSKVRRVDLRNRNLAFADFTDAFLPNADLRGANLAGAILFRAELQGVVLYDEYSNRGARLRGAHLQGAQLQGADLRGVQLQRAILIQAKLPSADLRGAQIQGAMVRYAELQGADLRGAQLQITDLRDAQLQGADLRGVQLQGADLSSARLQSAYLEHVQLQGADLREAHLQGAVLRGARLQGAVLHGARLQGADLGGARLQGADLREAGLWRAVVNRWPMAWDRADLRAIDVVPMPRAEIDKLIAEATNAILNEERRNAVVVRLTTALRTARHPGVLNLFPGQWRSEPNVMFEQSDPTPESFDWGPSGWDTGEDYDKDLAKLLGDLTCDREVPEAQTRGLASRALFAAQALPTMGGEPHRLWPRLFAGRVTGPDCPPAEGLPEYMRRALKELAALGAPGPP